MILKNLIDFHCHLDLYPEFESIIKECEQTGVYTLAVTTTPRAWPRNRDLTLKTKYVRAALGFHPQLIDKDYHKDLSLWEKYLPEACYIGEVGIDASARFSHTIREQTQAFEHILQCCSKAGGKILSVHCVRSASIILDVIEKNVSANRVGIVLHWFTGSIVEAKRAVAIGCYFSINPKMLKTKKCHDLLEVIPRERILTETDGPFTELHNKPAKPKDAANTVSLLAGIYNADIDIMARCIYSNLKILLKKYSSKNLTQPKAGE